MAVNYYATESELEGITALTFDGSSTPTATEAQALLTQWSATLDGLLGQAEQTLGNSGACPEWAKQTVLQTVAGIVEAMREGRPSPIKEALDTMRSMLKRPTASRLKSTITKKTPQIGTNDSNEVWE